MSDIYEDITFFNDQTFRPRANTPTEARRDVDWSRLSNERLMWAHNLLEAHHNYGYLCEVLTEIRIRSEAGTWLDQDQPPPPLHDLPQLLTVWPFSLLHKQRARGWGRG